MSSKLWLDQDKVARARVLAREIVRPVQAFIAEHTTTTVERATLRLLGADGANADGVPVANLVVDALGERAAHGATRYYVNALFRRDRDVAALNREIADGLDVATLPLIDQVHLEAKAQELVAAFAARVRANVAHRDAKLARYAAAEKSPLLYVIVATGNIYEDAKQARAAARQGADVIAVIRTTAQSLLDYVPYGATTDGFGGTYATQENFRIMREAIDEVVDEEQRYIRVVNYCSGLCMPEIAALGALERLDMMLNDAMYGILFRDINMERTFIDQNFSRMINAFADIVINTGEDNYLTTADAMEAADTVVASQLINEAFAREAGMPSRLMGLGHAFEIDPALENSFLYELAGAQLVREIFPDSPLKYMPPTRYMTGNIFRGVAQNALFNFVSKATQQSIHLLGMVTEAIHTPFLQDRFLAIENARYVMNSMSGLYDEIAFKPDGLIVRRARQVLDGAHDLLAEVAQSDLFQAIERGVFAEVKRPRSGGKGRDGVMVRAGDYWNPCEAFLQAALGVSGERGGVTC
ncbi:MAG: D-lysine 5,6-aminomutase subunit alpha [Deltaproteobacteria bacterium HGW-Deltaproteobacteria-14]|jgi:beta-lysine 5,6-aminomutase alpha subunit|nr:MAG: D-lysine 5,6-aminomutase subunit alpha [Deltaproteobacteria bacterium HGW-Deltaproteobacteria-14]